MKISQFVKRSIYVLSGCISLMLIILNVIYINNIDNTEFSNIENYKLPYLGITICIIVIIFLISYFINKIKVSKSIKVISLIFLFGIYAIVQVIWIYRSVAVPFADSEQILIISKGFLGKQDLIEYCYRYLEYYPQQITLSSIFSLVFFIANNTNYIIIQYLNIIFNIISMIGLYVIVCELSKKYNINKVIFFVLSLTFIPIILLSIFIYGDFVGMAFVIWGVYFSIKSVESGKTRFSIFSAMSISLACLLRMNYVIFAIAVVIYWIINILETKYLKAKNILRDITLIIVFIVIIMIPSNVLKNIYAKEYELNLEKSFSTIPYLYMGISEGDRGFGWYNDEIGSTVYHLMCDKNGTEKISKQCEEDFKSRVKYLLKNPKYTTKFYIKKIITMWAEPTMEFAFYNSVHLENINMQDYKLEKSIINGKIKEFIKIYQKGIMLLIFIGTLVTIIINFKQLDKNLVLFTLIFLGGFSFHILWEAKSRYIIPYFIILIPVACIGITELMEKIKNK